MSTPSTERITRYRQFCATAPLDFPIFMQDWYLDATCGIGHWEVIWVEQSGQLVAVWPFYLKKKGPWQYVAMPGMTRLLGPYLVPTHRSIHHEIGLLRELLLQLPRQLAAFEQDCNYNFQNWMPLYWEGFRQTTRYSYQVDLSGELTDIHNHIDKETRRQIRRADEQFTVDQGMEYGPAVFQLHEMGFQRQGMKSPFSQALFERVHETLCAHHAVQYFVLKKKGTDTPVAGQMLIWDRNSAYALIQGETADLRGMNARDLLCWSSLVYAHGHLKLGTFDFMGSMMPNIELGLRRFGARAKPYFRVQKEWSLWWRWGKLMFRTNC
jgi:hypothetical protein